MDSIIDEALTERVKAKALELGAAQVGIASAAILDEALTEGFRPSDVLPGCRSLVVMSLHIPDGSIEIMRRGKSAFSYNLFGYAYLNRELDFLLYKMSCFLEDLGWATMPIPARGTAYGTAKPGYAMLSFRHAAVASGLASFGLSGIALTKKYGSRQRFVALPTLAPLTPAQKLLAQSEVCCGCLECLSHCTGKALTLNPPHICKLGGITYRYARSDYQRCTYVSRGLSSKVWPGACFNPKTDLPFVENATGDQRYERLWGQRDGSLRIIEQAEATFGATICGRCMVFCSAGHQAMRRNLGPGSLGLGYDDEKALGPDGTLQKLEPKPTALGLKLLGLKESATPDL
jgi:Fe-S-cluster-containing hydrogenase component 2